MQRRQALLNCFIILLFALSVAACQEQSALIVDPSPTEIEVTAVPSHPEQQSKWENGPHANTYALEKGPNTYCAKCHAPYQLGSGGND
ncbi:MAG: hypothetical protein M5U34_35770 [Chloroflexi bacterium]|nr:hypothetical protein [Chloroflexota bacterium]